jgi:hypothetical protein
VPISETKTRSSDVPKPPQKIKGIYSAIAVKNKKQKPLVRLIFIKLNFLSNG